MCLENEAAEAQRDTALIWPKQNKNPIEKLLLFVGNKSIKTFLVGRRQPTVDLSEDGLYLRMEEGGWMGGLSSLMLGIAPKEKAKSEFAVINLKPKGFINNHL